MDRPRIYVDFNEMLDVDLVLLSKTDTTPDSDGNLVELREGMRVCIYSEDIGDDGEPDNLIADGIAERNARSDWSSPARWCCRIDAAGIRHESDLSRPR
jgi:hypothetical protein